MLWSQNWLASQPRKTSIANAAPPGPQTATVTANALADAATRKCVAWM